MASSVKVKLSPEQLQRATGAKPAAVRPAAAAPSPSAAARPPGSLPLPLGRQAASKTQEEILEGLNWREGDPLPEGADLDALVDQASQLADLSLYEAGLKKKGPPPKSSELGKMSPEERKAKIAEIEGMLKAHPDIKFGQPETPLRQPEAPSQAVESLVAEGRMDPSIAMAIKQMEGSSLPKAKEAAAAAAAPAASGFSPDGGKLVLCPRCRHPLAEPCPPQPGTQEKLDWLVCAEGLKPYVKRVKVAGGRITLTIRSLHDNEAEAIDQAVTRLLRDGKIDNQSQLIDFVFQSRAALQLVEYRPQNGETVSLPDGLSKTANPQCTAEWDFSDIPQDSGGPGDFVGESWKIVHVLTTMRRLVFVNESVRRLVQDAVRNFNEEARLMEDMAYRPDFIEATA